MDSDTNHRLSPDEARRQYARLTDNAASADSLAGKAAQMRAQFDTLLHLCVTPTTKWRMP